MALDSRLSSGLEVSQGRTPGPPRGLETALKRLPEPDPLSTHSNSPRKAPKAGPAMGWRHALAFFALPGLQKRLGEPGFGPDLLLVVEGLLHRDVKGSVAKQHLGPSPSPEVSEGFAVNAIEQQSSGINKGLKYRQVVAFRTLQPRAVAIESFALSPKPTHRIRVSN